MIKFINLTEHSLFIFPQINLNTKIYTHAHTQKFFFTLSVSSFSSSCAELDGDGVADILPGGEGELWVTEFPLIASWVWLMD